MESLSGALGWIQEHLRVLIGAALAILVVLILAVAYLGYAQGREGRADLALARALRTYQAPIDPVAASPEDETAPTFASASARAQKAEELFTQTVDDFGRSKAAGIASVYLGQIAADAGDLTTAREYWQGFLSRADDSALAIEVRVNLMGLDRAQGRGDELVTELRALLSSADSSLPPDLLWYQLGVTLEELDRQTEAHEAFQRLVEEYPQSAYAPDARERTGSDASSLFGT